MLGFIVNIRNETCGKGKQETAIALIQDGSLPSQKVALGTIESILKIAKEKEIKAPAVIVIGEVVEQHTNFQKILVNSKYQFN